MAQTQILLESGTNELEILEFHINEVDEAGKKTQSYYGMNVAKVLEIIRLPKVTSLPQVSHPSVLGTFSLRNRVIPIMDLAAWLGKKVISSEADKVIVTEFSKVTAAFLVSGVTRIYRYSWAQVEAPDRYLQEFSGHCITGVVKVGDRVVFILDMEKIMADINPKLALHVPEAFTDHPEEAEAEPFKVLIADDSSSIRNLIRSTLEKSGFTVEAALHGRMAWERLETIKEQAQAEGRPLNDFLDIVISDIEMPEMDGHNLTRRIKSDPVLKALPVVLFSSLISDSLRHKGEAVGADFQVSKPDLPVLTTKAIELIREYRLKAGEQN